jgi:hypothetical protein
MINLSKLTARMRAARDALVHLPAKYQDRAVTEALLNDDVSTLGAALAAGQVADGTKLTLHGDVLGAVNVAAEWYRAQKTAAADNST